MSNIYRLLCLVMIFLISQVLNSQNLWLQTNGPYSARGQSLFFDRTTGNLFASTYGGDGVYLSSNGGSSWVARSNGIPEADIVSVLRSTSGKMFAGVYLLINNNYGFLSGVYASSDEGLNWTLTSLDSNLIDAIASEKLGKIYASSYSGKFYRSIDDGLNWESIYNAYPMISRSVAVSRNSNVYMSSDSKILRFPPYGDSWFVMSGGNVHGARSVTVDSAENVYAATSYGIFRYTGDTNWISTNPNQFFSSLFGTIPGTVYGGHASGQIFRTTDFGSTWSQLYQPVLTANQPTALGFAMDMNSNLYFGLDFQGFIKSTNNGLNWQRINNGMRNANMAALSIESSGKVFAGVWNDGIFTSTDRGASWQGPMLEGFYPSAIGFDRAGNVYAAGNLGNTATLYKSSNSGQTWVNTNLSYSGFWINHIYCNSLNYIYVSYQNYGIYRSTDGGTTWQNMVSGGYIYDFRITPDDYVWYISNGLYRSTNYGMNWNRIDSANLSGGVIAMSTSSFGEYYVSTYQSVYRSTNAGNNWFMVYNQPMNFLINNSYGYLFGVTNDGVYQSNNGGSNWIPVSTGINPRGILMLAIDSTGFLYAGTNGKGVYRSAATTLYVEKGNVSVPKDIILSQNYPNPFNPVTNIRFSIPRYSRTVLTLYDATGRVVKALFDDFVPAGEHLISFDASSLASGVYFYSLENQSVTITKKMLLVK